MSLTLKALAGLILAQMFGLSDAETAQFISTLGTIIATFAIWYGRYRAGDINWWGKKLRE